MAEKNMRFSLLLDFYGELLSEAQRNMMWLYYNEDLSLSEIAEQVGITRQGVRDAIHRAEETLSAYEEKLRIAARFSEQKKAVADVTALAETLVAKCREQKESALVSLAEAVLAEINEICL